MRRERSPGCSGVSSVVCPMAESQAHALPREPGSRSGEQEWWGCKHPASWQHTGRPGGSPPAEQSSGAPGPSPFPPSRSVDSNQFPTLLGKPGGSGPRAGDALGSGAGCFLPASIQDSVVWEPWAEAGVRRCIRRARPRLWGIPAGGLVEDGRGQPWPRLRGVTQTPHHLVTRGASLQGCLDYSPIEWWRFTCRIGNSVLRIKVRHRGCFSTGTPGSRPVLTPTSPFHSVYPVWMTDDLNVLAFKP